MDGRPLTFQEWLKVYHPIVGIAPAHSHAYREGMRDDLVMEFQAYLLDFEQYRKNPSCERRERH